MILMQKFQRFKDDYLAKTTLHQLHFPEGLWAEGSEWFSKLSHCWPCCGNLTTSPLYCKVLVCLSHLQSPFTWIPLHLRKCAQFPKKDFGGLRHSPRAGGYQTGLVEDSQPSMCQRPRWNTLEHLRWHWMAMFRPLITMANLDGEGMSLHLKRLTAFKLLQNTLMRV